MDAAQLLLIIVVAVLTVLLTVIGIQVYYILKEFRLSVRKLNELLDNTNQITGAVAKPVASISDSLVGLAGTLSALTMLFGRKRKEQ